MDEAQSLPARDRHLYGPGPKRILAIDGGGVRGAVAIAFLERLESLIAEIEGRPVRLCDWFDLIGGTSTGAIIATALALGYGTQDIRRFYERLAPLVFRKAFYRIAGWQAKFDARLLLSELGSVLGTRTLDSEDLQTGLGVLIKRMDTGSSWIILNNPRSAFWNSPADGSFIGNRHIRLANLVRASTAAPTYFDPELIAMTDGGDPGLFIDGGLTPHMNPALMLLLTAAIPAYGLNWRLGPEHLTIVSVGTGRFRTQMSHAQAKRARALGLAMTSLSALIDENQQLTMLLMSWLGQSPQRWRINSEVGDLGAVVPPFGALFRFLRYDIVLEQKWLAEVLGETVSDVDLRRLRLMDEPASIPSLYALGRKAALAQVVRRDWG